MRHFTLTVICLVAMFCFAKTLHAGEPSEAVKPWQALQERGLQVVLKDGEPYSIGHRDVELTEADLRRIGQCKTLKKLTLDSKLVTDETLPWLSGLTQLEELSINQSQLTDAGYKHFQPLQSLKVLRLWHPSWNSKEFTGAGLAHLKALPSLERFTVAGSTAGDPLMEAVGELTQLKEFQTWHTRQTQAGNAALTKLENLQRLKIGQRLPEWGKETEQSFNGETIPTLAKIKTLTELELFEARLQADDLTPLRDLPNLQKLKIHTVDISADDVETVKKMLPEVEVQYEPLTDEQREMLSKKLKL